MLGEAMQTIDFSRLDASKVNLENIEIGANRARDLASALELVNAQLNQISQTSLTDAIASTMEKATTSIIAAISPESVKKEQNKQEDFVKWQSYGKLGYAIITLIISLFAGILFNVYAHKIILIFS